MKLRWIVRLCALGLAVGLFSGQSALANTSGTVSGTNVNIRSAATTTSAVLTQKSTGFALDIIAKEGSWYKIQLTADQIGYIYGDFVKETAVSAEAQTVEVKTVETKAEAAAEPASTEELGYVNGSNVNFRTTASTASTTNIIGKLNYGDTVVVLKTEGDWHYVRSESGKTGYLYKKFVTLGKIAVAENAGELRNQVVNYAHQFLGLAYVYGGTSLSYGTDCSGFTQQIFKNFGISLNRSSGDQSLNGTSVSVAGLQPGDLVFYGYSSSINHVAIYIGNGQIIHNTVSGGGVRISNMYNMGGQSIICCRSVIQ